MLEEESTIIDDRFKVFDLSQDKKLTKVQRIKAKSTDEKIEI